MILRSLRRCSLIIIALSALGAGACVSGKVVKKEPEAPKTPPKTEAAAPQAAVSTAAIPNVEATEASIRGAEFVSTIGINAIYFDYDSSTLRDDALASLKNNAEYLKEHAELEVLVAGFCDERGTVEYNLALGQKRAKEVREYYIRLGVPGNSMGTISYGKESLACSEHSEDCWAKNRRVETRIRTRTVFVGETPNKNAQ